MSVGLASRFSILQQSPHDFELQEGELPVSGSAPARNTWIPSRYTLRARTTDGRLILWSSYTGAISVFEASQASAIEAMLKRQGIEADLEGIVKYLVDRGFLIRKETDEYARFQFAFGKRQHRSDALELILLASEDCNFRCVYCYEDFARGTMRPEVRQGLKKYVESRLPGLRSLHIGWFGGEPLYGFQAIEDLAPFFWQAAQEHSLQFLSHMTTNGYLLTPDVAEKLLTWQVKRFQITLDGPAQCHDQTRPTRNGEGSFDVILRNLKALSQRPEDFQVHMRVNFNPQNLPHVDELMDIVEKEFHNDSRFRLRFRAVGRWGGGKDEQVEVCEHDQGNRLLYDLERRAEERGLTLADGFKAGTQLGSQVCYAARPNHFVIGATGKVMKCTVALDRREQNVLGSVTPDGQMEIDRDKLALWAAPYFEKDSQCQSCTVLPICQGFSCPLPRVLGGDRPCLPIRDNWKKELRSTVERKAPVRQRVV